MCQIIKKQKTGEKKKSRRILKKRILAYPIARIVNDEADDLQKEAALDFIYFLTSDTAKEVHEKYYFDTNVE